MEESLNEFVEDIESYKTCWFCGREIKPRLWVDCFPIFMVTPLSPLGEYLPACRQCASILDESRGAIST
jgi:hypothetical protein